MTLIAVIRGTATKEFKHCLEVVEIFRNYYAIKKIKDYLEIFIMIAFSHYFLYCMPETVHITNFPLANH